MADIKPIFATVYSADFYPEDKPDNIQITVDAPKDTETYGGKVVILPIEQYWQLTQTQQALDSALEALKAAEDEAANLASSLLSISRIGNEGSVDYRLDSCIETAEAALKAIGE